MNDHFLKGTRIFIVGIFWSFSIFVDAQTSNGPLFGIFLDRLDGSLSNDYRAFNSSVQGLGGSLGYFVEGTGERAITLRGEFHGSVRRYLYDFKNFDAAGDYRITISSLQLPLLFKIRLNEGLRLIMGPAVELRFLGNAQVKGTRTPSGADIHWSDDFTEHLKPLGVSLIGGFEYRTNGPTAIGLRAQKGLSQVVRNIKGVDATTLDLCVVISFDILGGRGTTAKEPSQQ